MKILEKDGILKFRAISSIFLFNFALVLGGTLWAYFSFRNASGPVIIHFNNLTGINVIGSYWSLISFGATGLVIIFINFIIAIELEERDRFLGKLVTATTVLLSSLIFIALAAIISVN